jgi:hypothetical protein
MMYAFRWIFTICNIYTIVTGYAPKQVYILQREVKPHTSNNMEYEQRCHMLKIFYKYVLVLFDIWRPVRGLYQRKS